MHDSQPFDLEFYLSEGVESIVKQAIRATARNPRGSLFLARYARKVNRAAQRRHTFEERGEHIPLFLIASITTDCNLKCTGCYSQSHSSCRDTAQQMSADEWDSVFFEAEELGITMILLAGGEPMMRGDVITKASEHPGIVFPLFTNGTLLNDESLSLFEQRRNLIPIVSIEGDRALTDARRGAGVFESTLSAMEQLRQRDLLFGASITVTQENLQEVTDESSVRELQDKGCKVLLFIEYVPVDERDIALSPQEQALLDSKVQALRSRFKDTIIISFPGDEKEAGGCLAAGRGFVHINAAGGAEPCPFSPYSDTNVREQGLLGSLRSPLFTYLKDSGILLQEHTGGCVLFYQDEKVQQALAHSAIENKAIFE